MQYTKANMGRLFVLKFSDGDVLIEQIAQFAKKERLRSAVMVFIGALKQGELVCGPKKPVIPPQANWVSFKGGWEVMGLGTVFTNKSGPQIHIHASMGKKNKVLTGCVRKESRVFLVIEAVVFELKDVKASKDIDPKTGLNLLQIFNKR